MGVARLGKPQFALVVLAVLTGVFAAMRRASVTRAAKTLGTKIPRGAMSIRRDSLVDLTVDGRPVRQTVFVAESSDEVEQDEIISNQTESDPSGDGFGDDDVVTEEDLARNDSPAPLPEVEPEQDPGEDNTTGTMTDLVPDPGNAKNEAAELYAEAEAVLAEAAEAEEETLPIEQAAADKPEPVKPEPVKPEPAKAEPTKADTQKPAPAKRETPKPKTEKPATDKPSKSASQSATKNEDAKSKAGNTNAEGDDENDGGAEVKPRHLTPTPGPKTSTPQSDGSCPLSHPIKARYATGRYHEPGSGSYENVVADVCYATAEAAEADGFSRSPL